MKHTDLNPASAGNFDGRNLPIDNGVSEVNTVKRRNDGGNAVARSYKKVVGGIVVAFVVAIAVNNVFVSLESQQGGKPSMLTLAGIEALGEDTETKKPKPCSELPNNANGGNIYLYCNRGPTPNKCTLKKYVDTKGHFYWTDGKPEAGFTWNGEYENGMEETCPKPKGNGCTVYSCHKTNNI